MAFSELHILLFLLLASFSITRACSNGECKILDGCSSDQDCGNGLFCSKCIQAFSDSKCLRSKITDQFKLLNNTLPFNKYAFLTTHNSFSIEGYPSHTGVPRLTLTNQEDSITQQLNNGVRALMLDTYDYEGDVWLCHSSGGKCHLFTAFGPALETLKEVESFLSSHPSEIVTLILEDYVTTPNALKKVFTDAGLMKYWFPVSQMPSNGQDWPLVSALVASNQRLIVFTSKRHKQDSEGIAYQWNFMVENQYGNQGMEEGSCSNRGESSPLDDKSKSLVLVNYFYSLPLKQLSCVSNSGELLDMLNTCHGASGNRWANFVAVDFYKRSDGGGAFQATDMLNGRLLCGCSNVHTCAPEDASNAHTLELILFINKNLKPACLNLVLQPGSGQPPCSVSRSPILF